MDFTLDATQVRALGCLMEKELSTPEYCPLSLNALVNACNQKTNRQPVLALDADTVDAALRSLKDQQLVVQSDASRVPKFWQALGKQCHLIDREVALLCLLMLRGPQTAGELRINAERWYRFADISSVEAFLDELQERRDEKGGPLVVQLARAPGAREQRWAHLLCGPVDASSHGVTAGAAAGATGSSPALQARVDALEAEVDSLKATVQRLCSELGMTIDLPVMSPPGQE